MRIHSQRSHGSPRAIAVVAAGLLAGLCGCAQGRFSQTLHPEGKDVERPQHPDEAIQFRYDQRRSENGLIPPNALMRAKAHRDTMVAAQVAQRTTAGISQLIWEPLGPDDVGGRVRALVIHPTDVFTMWLGSASGGIWKTTDRGINWFPLNDFMATLSVASLAIDPDNPDVLYAGTGEGFNEADQLPGAGVFKSSDGGTTWTQLASTKPTNTDPRLDPWGFVNRIAISQPPYDVANPQVILAATNQGIQRSVDGGQNWTQETTGRTLDVKYHPTDKSKAVAGRDDGKAVYTTDRGDNWPLATGITPGKRVELAYAPNDGNTVYASVERNGGELYRSTDGGQTYVLRTTNPSTDPNYLETQGGYDNVIWVDPTNKNRLLVGGIDLWRSANAGALLTQVSNWERVPNPGDSAHADQHVIVHDPDYDGNFEKTVFVGNDGGVFETSDVTMVQAQATNPPNPADVLWSNANGDLAITQFYGAAITSAGILWAGSQDNFVSRYDSSTDDWTQPLIGGFATGDAGYCAIDPDDQQHFYSAYPYLEVFRSSDSGVTGAEIHTGLTEAGDKNKTNFIAPLVHDPNPSNTLFGGARQLWRSTNASTAADWSSVKVAAGNDSNHNISAIAVAPGNSNLVWVGHNNGELYRSNNATNAAASVTWTTIDDNSSPNPLPNRWVTSILIDKDNNNHVYVTFSGYADDSVWKTENAGTAWTRISRRSGTATCDPASRPATALPCAPANWIVRHPTRAAVLYVGMDVGVFATTDDGMNWSTQNEGPVNTAVDHLMWQGNSKLYAVTHGRGIFLAELDCNGNGVADDIDIAMSDSDDDNTNGIPDECEPIVYVDAAATGLAGGTNWRNAYTDLQAGLTKARTSSFVTEVWVAEGTYIPTDGTTQGDSFELIADKAIYGGFNGDETKREDRNWRFRKTILSGNIGNAGLSSDNSYHVVTAPNGADADTILDGFVITEGVANHHDPDKNSGGGLFFTAASPTIRNCLIGENRAVVSGGGLACRDGASPTFFNCVMVGNVSIGGGAGDLFDSSPKLINCSIVANTADDPLFNDDGGGLRVNGNSNPVLTNTILWGNQDGGGMDESAQIHVNGGTPVINYCDIQGLTGGLGGNGNIDADPKFTDADGFDNTAGTLDDELELDEHSPCVDAGDNGAVLVDGDDIDGDGDNTEKFPLDFDNDARFYDDQSVADTGAGTAPMVDIGAYERQEDSPLLCPGDGNGDGVINIADLGLVLSQFGLSGGSFAGDVDGDGDVDISDLGLVLANFGLFCG